MVGGGDRRLYNCQLRAARAVGKSCPWMLAVCNLTLRLSSPVGWESLTAGERHPLKQGKAGSTGRLTVSDVLAANPANTHMPL